MRERTRHGVTGHSGSAGPGDHSATRQVIAEAHRQFEQISGADDHPSWVQQFDEPKLIVDTGIAHAQLGAISPERVRGHLREFHRQLEPFRQVPAAVAFDVRLRELPH